MSSNVKTEEMVLVCITVLCFQLRSACACQSSGKVTSRLFCLYTCRLIMQLTAWAYHHCDVKMH